MPVKTGVNSRAVKIPEFLAVNSRERQKNPTIRISKALPMTGSASPSWMDFHMGGGSNKAVCSCGA
jgi:hypothetical protein